MTAFYEGAATRWAVLLALSFVLAAGLAWISLPAPYLLGPIIVAVAFSAARIRLRVAPWLLTGAQAVIGCAVARAIDPPALLPIAQDWAGLLMVVTVTILASTAVGFFLVRQGVLPGTTAAWGSAPGAASLMIMMSREFGADIRIVAMMQYLRMVIVVFTTSAMARFFFGHGQFAATNALIGDGLFAVPLVPFGETVLVGAAGIGIARMFAIPAGNMLIPMAIGIALQAGGIVQIALPQGLLDLTYAVIGCYVGLSFDRDVFAYALSVLPQILLGILLLIGLCALSAVALAWITHNDLLTAYLATTPGGLDSVVIIAMNTHADIPFVMAAQTLRLIVVILAGPQIAKLICRYAMVPE